MKNKGFTLLELIIVLVIIGLMAMFIAPTVAGSLINLRLKAATKQLSTVLRYARSKAISSKNTIQVVINIDNASYSADVPKSGERGVRSTTFPQGVSFRQVKIGQEAQTSGLVQILFYPKGNTTGGEITLENSRGRLYRLTIDNLTGKVRIRRWSEEEGWG